MEFGRYIAQKRQELGLSQTELANKISREDGRPISPQYLNDIEHGRRSPSATYLLEQFARILKVELDYLQYLAGKLPDDIQGMDMDKDQVIKLMEAFRSQGKSGG